MGDPYDIALEVLRRQRDELDDTIRRLEAMQCPEEPAARVVAAFGGVQALAKAIDRDPSRVHRWTYPVEKTGTGGRIPGSAVPDILAAAAKLGIALTANDLFPAPAPVPRRKARAA